jgi:2-polyprenyl-3-methyl-5-hydroxy-6-metoxy-1,4-benzoquinol methylase
MDFSQPILMDNSNLRKDVPDTDLFFSTVIKELESLPREGNLVVDPKLVTRIPCPVCGDEGGDQLFVRAGFLIVQCPNCAHVYVKNRINEEYLQGLYAGSVSEQIYRRIRASDFHKRYWRAVHLKYLDYFRQTGCENANVFDVGCGAGNFLDTCKETTGYALHGLDFCEDSFDFIVSVVGRDNYYYRQRIEDVDFGAKRFGLITLWGVLEHLVTPASVLEKCGQILAPGGRVILLVPNLFSRAFRILGITTPTIYPRGHLHYYTPRSMEHLVRRAGLTIEARFQELPVIDLMHPFIHYDDALVRDIVAKDECYYHVYVLRRP